MEEQAMPQDYFTAEIHERMRNLSESEMVQNLKNLEASEFWISILKYNQMRLTVSQSALFIGDPVKDPAGMCRQQGIMLGLSDLQNAVVSLIQEAQAEASDAESGEEGTDVE